MSPVLEPMLGLDRTFLSQASALDMLCREGMDLNRLLRHGVRYLSRDEERRIRVKETDRAAGVREDISIDEGGEKFLARVKYTDKWHLNDIRTEIQEWLHDTSAGKYHFCNITVSSSYYKRILHQTLPSMFPNLTIGSSKKHFVQIVENTGHTLERLESERKEKFENRIHESIGLRKIIDMLSVYRCILVGHNLFYDLIFIWSQFIEQLPETVQEFSKLISTTFPMSLGSLPLLMVGYSIRNISLPRIHCAKT